MVHQIGKDEQGEGLVQRTDWAGRRQGPEHKGQCGHQPRQRESADHRSGNGLAEAPGSSHRAVRDGQYYERGHQGGSNAHACGITQRPQQHRWVVDDRVRPLVALHDSPDGPKQQNPDGDDQRKGYKCPQQRHGHDLQASEGNCERGTQSGVLAKAYARCTAFERHDHHGHHTKHQAECHRHRRVEEAVRIDHAGEGVVAQQLHGTEVADHVEEHQQCASGDRRARLGHHHSEEHREWTPAQKACRLLSRRRHGAKACHDRQKHIRVREQREHAERAPESAHLGQRDRITQHLRQQTAGRERGDERNRTDKRWDYQRQAQHECPRATPGEVGTGHHPGGPSSQRAGSDGHRGAQEQAAECRGNGVGVGNGGPEAAEITRVADDQVGERQRERHRQQHGDSRAAEPPRALPSPRGRRVCAIRRCRSPE